MKRENLEHIIYAAGAISGVNEYVTNYQFLKCFTKKFKSTAAHLISQKYQLIVFKGGKEVTMPLS